MGSTDRPILFILPELIPALLMLPPVGSSPAEYWVAEGRRAAARDLLRRLLALDSVEQVLVLAAEQNDRDDLADLGGTPLIIPQGQFHFGHMLAHIVEEGDYQRFAYFGGGSAPLMTTDLLLQAFDRTLSAERPVAVVNNYHSSDWVVLNHAQSLLPLAARLPTDNPLGWVLDHEAGFDVHALPPSAATRNDIDTPTDILILLHHPNIGTDLREFLAQAPREWMTRIDNLRKVMNTPASTLTLIGRASSHVWQTLERVTQIWVRAFVEERGMVASGRMARSEVKSLIGEVLDIWGAQTFVEHLSSLSDAILWDTRVWMAHRGKWPSTADRFAADLGWVDQVEDSALRDLTQAINQASIPIVVGGYGVVSGGVYAMLEVLEGG